MRATCSARHPCVEVLRCLMQIGVTNSQHYVLQVCDTYCLEQTQPPTQIKGVLEV